MNVDDNAVVFWDHGSGEAADFIVLRPVADGGVSVIYITARVLAARSPVTASATSTKSARKRSSPLFGAIFRAAYGAALTEVLPAANSHRVGKYLIEGLFDVEPVG